MKISLQKNVFTESIYWLFVLFFLPQIVFGQKKELIVSNNVSKVAYVDHSIIRKEYKEYSLAKVTLAKEARAVKEALNQALYSLEEKYLKEIKIDSLDGGTKKEQIIKKYQADKTKLHTDYNLAQKKLNEDRIALTQKFEKEISTAIDKIITEEGLTDVQQITPNTKVPEGRNITWKILEKLN